MRFSARFRTLDTNLNDDDGAARVAVEWTTPTLVQPGVCVVRSDLRLGNQLRAHAPTRPG